MSSRRKFLKTASLSSFLLSSGGAFALNRAGHVKRKVQKPVVISTWDFGKEANAEAWKILQKAGRALDAVEAGVKIPEADPRNKTIGYGGQPDRDGYVTLDASIMDEYYNCGSVACIEHIMHPISVARLVMEKTPHVMLSGQGALDFALANGFEKINLLTPEREAEWKEWLKTSKYEPEKNIENKKYNKDNDPMPGGTDNHDTIGLLALDEKGNLSGACTTSGLAYKMHGRVGDSPIIGAGLYVDNEVGAATSSGVGEEVMRIVGSHLVVEQMRAGLSPTAACKAAVERIIKINSKKAAAIQVGFIALAKNGEYGCYSLQPGFTLSVRNNHIDRIIKSESHYR